MARICPRAPRESALGGKGAPRSLDLGVVFVEGAVDPLGQVDVLDDGVEHVDEVGHLL